METTNTQIQSEPEERRLWSKCEMFYGTGATNFMCSKCFKEEKESKGGSQANSVTTADAIMIDNKKTDAKSKEEEKAPSKPIQVSQIHSSPIF